MISCSSLTYFLGEKYAFHSKIFEMRTQSTDINIETSQQEQSNRNAPSANSCTSEESEESLPDSLEEARAPLIRRPHSIQEDEIRQDNMDNADEENIYGDKQQLKNKRKIPKERRKTGYAFLLLVFAGFLNDFVLSYIHELIPESPPLPDVAFSILPYWPWALIVSEVFMISSFSVMFVVAIAHKYRWAVLRRIFTIGFLLYLGRCATMFVTQVPVADPNYYCSPKLKPEERTFWNILVRALSVLIGLGLKINGRHTLCGDYIYSGHTIVHVLCYLFIREYSPRRWIPLHFLAFFFSSLGVLSLLFSRGHYSIDVIIAYWITTRIFWYYHTLADFPDFRHGFHGRNRFVNVIWYPLFIFMEKSVHRPLPRKYELPFKLPNSLIRFWQGRRGRSNSQDRFLTV
ncbi:PAP2_C domain-containing protein [Meloidogyne graminicola]|uniref:PAP2_C domain-containing protein n=1 Tax=Meloidogyne graminicola TaxID=189291 RepID=A0A8S9ZC29_9BILA|nr:PAP2_C domain-containing protein [Meloidogyne graminicola]